jgi:chlorite dismutase
MSKIALKEGQKMFEDKQGHATEQRKIVLTAFMLVKSMPEWYGFSKEERSKLLAMHVEPILKKHSPEVTLRLYDVEFYSARVTDVWIWEAKDHLAYELLVEDLRETPFWDRYFQIVEILPGVENAYVNNSKPGLSAA